VEVELIGVSGRRRASPSGRARAADTLRPVLGHWTRTVRAEDFGLNGALIRLPFDGVQPDSDPHLRGYAWATVRLTVAGQGVYEATVEGVELRRSGGR
jgi:hypothetical protein